MLRDWSLEFFLSLFSVGFYGAGGEGTQNRGFSHMSNSTIVSWMNVDISNKSALLAITLGRSFGRGQIWAKTSVMQSLQTAADTLRVSRRLWYITPILNSFPVLSWTLRFFEFDSFRYPGTGGPLICFFKYPETKLKEPPSTGQDGVAVQSWALEL